MIEIRRHLGFCRYLPGFTGYANPPPRSGFCKEVASFQWDTGWVSPQIFDSAWVTRRFVTALGLGAFKFDLASPFASRGIRLIGVGLVREAAHVIIVRRWVVIICKTGIKFFEDFCFVSLMGLMVFRHFGDEESERMEHGAFVAY